MAKNFAAALEQQLQAKGITAYRLSQLTGISKATVSKLFHGHVQPGWETVAKISKALGVSCEVFVTDDLGLPDAPDARPPGRPPGEVEKPAPAKKKGK